MLDLELLKSQTLPAFWRFTPVNGTKAPYLSGWQNKPYTWNAIIDIASKDARCHAVGILTGVPSFGILAVDHDGISCDPLIEKLSGLPVEEALPKTVGFTSGKEGRYQLLYQIDQKFGPYMQGRSILTGVKGAGNKGEQLDLRWSGKQSTFLGTHPETGAYRYRPGQSPTEVKVAECPLWIIRQTFSFRSLLPKSRKLWQDSDWALEYLSFIPNHDLDWYQYRDILLALHHSQVEEEYARIWSATSDKHTDKGFDSVWNYIDDDCTNPITVATLSELAKQNGWKGRSPHSQSSEDDPEETKTELRDLMGLENIHCPNVLPDEIFKPLSKLAQRLNLPVEAYVSVLLTVASTQLKVKNRLAIDPSTGFYVPPIVWIGVVGESGSKKSPLIKALLSPLDGLQEKAEEDYQTKLETFETELEEWNESEKGNRGRKPKDKPTPREYYLSDFTMEALVEVLVRQKEDGLLIFIEELARFFNAMDAYRSGKGGDRQQWLSSYDGGPVKSNRKTTGRGYVPKTNISIAGGIQPSIVQKIMLSDTSVEDGLWARLAWVKTPLSIAQGISGDTHYDLTDLLATLYEKLNEFEGVIYQFSPEAQRLWNDWHFEIESKILKEPSNILRATLPKAKERAARIALICHLIHAATKGEQPSTDISAETLATATQFNRWLMGQTRLLYAELGVAENPEIAKILKFVKRFQGCGWITAKMTIHWHSSNEKPTADKAREFMAKVVSLEYAKGNGKRGSEYKILINNSGNPVTNTSQTHTEQGIDLVTRNGNLPGNPVTEESLEENNTNSSTTQNESYQSYREVTTSGNRLEPSESKGLNGSVTELPQTSNQKDFSLVKELVNSSQSLVKPTHEVVTNPRQACTVSNDRVDVDLDKLDLNYQSEIPIPNWQPNKEPKPYEQLSKLYFDIETSGLYPNSDRVYMVGLLDEQGNRTIITDPDEKILLSQTMKFIKTHQPELLIGHNLFEFDLPFLISRCKKLRVSHPFKPGSKPKTITASSFHGRPIQFTPIYRSGTQILDTQQQACIWDKNAAKLTGYGLKPVVLTLGLRNKQRLELSVSEIRDYWDTGDLQTIKEYLAYDLEDTQRLADFLIPVVYYQLSIVPGLSFQELAVASPALKAEKVHELLLPSVRPEADKKLAYDGALIRCPNPGLHRQAAKIDISSLYPSVMIRYGICSRKDPEHRFLGVMQYMRGERLRLKALANAENQQADHEQNALKILINGSYGYFGTSGYPFNDYKAAALVSSYGRKILQQMVDTVQAAGATVIELDTDGIFFNHNEPRKITEQVQKALPEGIQVELEFSNVGIYIPKAKSYVIVYPDGKTLIKGLFRKRDRYPLEREFPEKFLLLYFNHSSAEADDYYHQTRVTIQQRQIPIERLTITRKIGKSEKRLVQRGLGNPGDKVSFYFVEQKRCHARSGKPLSSVAVESTTGDYWIDRYIRRLDEQYQEITGHQQAKPNHQLDLSLPKGKGICVLNGKRDGWIAGHYQDLRSEGKKLR